MGFGGYEKLPVGSTQQKRRKEIVEKRRSKIKPAKRPDLETASYPFFSGEREMNLRVVYL